MKTLFQVSIFVCVCALVSCGGSKKVVAYDYPGAGYNNKSVQVPTKRKREVDECIKLAEAETDRYRAWGTAISYQEENAVQNAEANAVTKIVQRMETAVEGARQIYNKDANANTKKMTEGDIQAIITQYIVGKCKNYRVIKTSPYDLSDGTIQYYVCIELRDTKNDIINTVDNALTRDDIISIEYDKQRFIKSIEQGLENYKNSRK